jgi:hypothetical protein
LVSNNNVHDIILFSTIYWRSGLMTPKWEREAAFLKLTLPTCILQHGSHISQMCHTWEKRNNFITNMLGVPPFYRQGDWDFKGLSMRCKVIWHKWKNQQSTQLFESWVRNSPTFPQHNDNNNTYLPRKLMVDIKMVQEQYTFNRICTLNFDFFPS